MTKYVNQTAAAKKISAYAIVDGKGNFLGKIQFHHSDSKCVCNLWPGDYVNSKGEACLYGSASGYGYNKENAALERALESIAAKEVWDTTGQCYKNVPCTLSADNIAKIGSYGPCRIGAFFDCTVIQAI